MCDEYSYGDNKTVGVCDRNYDGLHIKFRQVGNEKLKWRFDVNIMQANPSKFHCIVVSKKLGKTVLVFKYLCNCTATGVC